MPTAHGSTKRMSGLMFKASMSDTKVRDLLGHVPSLLANPDSQPRML